MDSKKSLVGSLEPYARSWSWSPRALRIISYGRADWQRTWVAHVLTLLLFSFRCALFQRCDELLSVNQPLAALSSISEVFSSKRFRTTPLSTLEPILIKFLGLCVELKKGRTAKEGLHMYKNVAQNTSVGSVEVVIQHFLASSRDKLAEALAKVEQVEGPAVAALDKDGAPTSEVEDLEASETPESILLSTVSEEKSRDRTYRTLVTPWLRFLWEAYRTALDILRNNPRLEILYQVSLQLSNRASGTGTHFFFGIF